MDLEIHMMRKQFSITWQFLFFFLTGFYIIISVIVIGLIGSAYNWGDGDTPIEMTGKLVLIVIIIIFIGCVVRQYKKDNHNAYKHLSGMQD